MENIMLDNQFEKHLNNLVTVEGRIDDIYNKMADIEFLYGIDSDEYRDLLEKLQIEFSNEKYYENAISVSVLSNDFVITYLNILGCKRLIEKIKCDKKYQLERFKLISEERRLEIVEMASKKLGSNVSDFYFDDNDISDIISSITNEYSSDLNFQTYFLYLLDNSRLGILQKEIDREEDESRRRVLINFKYSLLKNTFMTEQVNFGLLNESDNNFDDIYLFAQNNGVDVESLEKLKNVYFQNVTRDIIEGLLQDLTFDRNIDLLSEINIRANLSELDEAHLGEVKFFIELVVPETSQLNADLNNIFDNLREDKKSVEMFKRKTK